MASTINKRVTIDTPGENRSLIIDIRTTGPMTIDADTDRIPVEVRQADPTGKWHSGMLKITRDGGTVTFRENVPLSHHVGRLSYGSVSAIQLPEKVVSAFCDHFDIKSVSDLEEDFQRSKTLSILQVRSDSDPEFRKDALEALGVSEDDISTD